MNRTDGKLNILTDEEWARFSKYVKDHCVMCKTQIQNPKENYIARGNYCAFCNGSMELRIKAKQKTNGKSRKKRYEEPRDFVQMAFDAILKPYVVKADEYVATD